MRSITALFLIAFLAIALTSTANELLSGNQELTSEEELHLFEAYIYEYGTQWGLNSQNEISFDERRVIFSSNLKKIIEHNRNPSKTYIKGLFLYKFLNFIIF